MVYQQEFLQRVPPHSAELELAVLSAIIQEPKTAMPIAQELLSPHSFYFDTHSVIYRACELLFVKGSPPDVVSLIAHLKELGQLESAGGESYLYQVVAAVPDASLVAQHAKIVREKQLLRDLIATCNDLISLAYAPDPDVVEVLDTAEKRILAIDTGLGSGEFMSADTAIKSFQDTFSLEETIEDGAKRVTLKPPPVITSGYKDVDKYTGGWRKGEFIIIGARPSVGKTAIALNFGYHAAKAGKNVGIFSLEMSNQQLASRLLAMEAGVAGHIIRSGNMNDLQLYQVDKATNELKGLPMWFDDQADISARSLRGRARRMQQKHNIDLILVDYLQLMTADVTRRGGELNRVNEMTEVSRTLKAIAKELKVPIIVASQLSRNVEYRNEKKPMLSDLRDSGSLEQDADVVILLYRNDYYDKEAMDTGKSKVEVEIAKNRNGRTGRAYLNFVRDYTRYEEHIKDETPEVNI